MMRAGPAARRNRPRFLRIARVVQRRAVAWLDRRAGLWLPFVPSWGGSVLLHAVLLLILALILYASGRDRKGDGRGQFAGQLLEDLTSLVPSDHAGDPFTTLKSEEPPSLSLEPPKADETAINQPMLPDLARFTPDLAGPELTRTPDFAASVDSAKNPRLKLAKEGAARSLSTVVSGLHAEDLTAPFSGRDVAARARLVRREGGTVKSEAAVEAGLNWIARHQKTDGGWALNYHGQCQGGCPPETCIESETAATGLALLPLLGAGHTHTAKSRYQTNIRGGLNWLVTHQQPNGDLYVGGSSIMAHLYSHAIGTMALCEAYGLTKDATLRAPAQYAINFIEQSQSADGGWRYAPGQAGDTSVFGWQMFALRSARLSGLKVSKTVLRGCRNYLDAAAADQKKITYSYLPGRPLTPVMTAEALLSRQYLGWQRDYPPLVKGAGMVAVHLEESNERNIYYWYYATQLLHNMQNKDWERWNVKVRDGLVSMQTGGDGCDRGSWHPNSPQPDVWASSAGRAGAGRLFLTALSTLTLEVYYRFLPLYQPSDVDRDKLNPEAKEAAAGGEK